MQQPNDTESALWDAHDAGPTSETRNALVRLYTQHAHNIASAVWRKLATDAGIPEADLQAESVLGLIELIDSGRFDREHGVKFTTFCTLRLRGHLIDCLRKHDWVPRHSRNKQKRGECQPQRIVYDSDSAVLQDAICQRADAAGAIDRVDVLRELTTGCSKRERLIVIMRYYEDMQLKQIAEALGVTESRVSQMHRAILARIRSRFAA